MFLRQSLAEILKVVDLLVRGAKILQIVIKINFFSK